MYIFVFGHFSCDTSLVVMLELFGPRMKGRGNEGGVRAESEDENL